MAQQPDRVTIEIIQSSLRAVADEMSAAMVKTAMSSIIYEVLDFGVAVTDARGRLAAAGAGIPAFVSLVYRAVGPLLEKYAKPGDIQPGDVFMTNDPYAGGVSHLNDVNVVMPVFAGETLIAWCANKAHWNDIGGMAPGGFSIAAREIFQEGLQLPEIRIIERGTPNQSVIDIIRANSRQPEYMIGDMWAGIASIRVGARRIEKLAEKYGAHAITHAIETSLDYGAASSLRALATLPKGEFAAGQVLDDGRIVRVVVTIRDDRFIVDLRDNPPQSAGPMNISRRGTEAICEGIFKAVTAPHGLTNAGSFRPLQVLTKEGTLFHAMRPAPCATYYEVLQLGYDLIWKALASGIPDRLPAGHFGSTCATFISGTNPDTGRYYATIEPELGGWGAAQDADGISGHYTATHGDTYNCPVEIQEARSGVVIDQLALNITDAGHGRYRGGFGITLDYRMRAADAAVTAAYSRSRIRPWGMNGGHEGSNNFIKVLRTDGSEEIHSQVSSLELARGDVVRVVTAAGGGYGNPRERAREAVLLDLKNGYITIDQAREIYGLGIE